MRGYLKPHLTVVLGGTRMKGDRQPVHRFLNSHYLRHRMYRLQERQVLVHGLRQQINVILVIDVCVDRQEIELSNGLDIFCLAG